MGDNSTVTLRISMDGEIILSKEVYDYVLLRSEEWGNGGKLLGYFGVCIEKYTQVMMSERSSDKREALSILNSNSEIFNSKDRDQITDVQLKVTEILDLIKKGTVVSAQDVAIEDLRRSAEVLSKAIDSGDDSEIEELLVSKPSKKSGGKIDFKAIKEKNKKLSGGK